MMLPRDLKEALDIFENSDFIRKHWEIIFLRNIMKQRRRNGSLTRNSYHSGKLMSIYIRFSPHDKQMRGGEKSG